jgi:uncharacterized damage-inducible protein DinB
MKINELLLPEFDQEVANTRKTLERVPEEKFDWKPHEKSMPLGRLAIHLAELTSWVVDAINRDSFDVAPPGQPAYQPPVIKSRKELLDLFDKNVGNARNALAGATDEQLAKNWSLLSGGNTVMTLPRTMVLRSFIFNHGVHHRAQLGVYLRLNGIPVPAIYGPSADENPM